MDYSPYRKDVYLGIDLERAGKLAEDKTEAEFSGNAWKRLAP